MDVGQVFQGASVIHGGMAICDLDIAPAFERSKHHEEVGGAVTLVLVIETGRASRRLPALILELLTIRLVTLQSLAALEVLKSRCVLRRDFVEPDRHEDAE